VNELTSGQVTGRYAGPVSRLLGFAVDGAVALAIFGILTTVVAFTFRLLLGIEIDTDGGQTGWWLLTYLAWFFLYHWASLAITGRTAGKWLVGVRVVERDGSPLRGRPALVRVLTFPLSVVTLGLGLVGILIGRERRALHDVLAGSVVVYDWGDRPAEMPAPLTRWLERQGAIENPAAATEAPSAD